MIRYFVFLLLWSCYPCVPRRPSRWHGKLSSSSNSTLTAACGEATTVLENPWAAILYYEGSFQCGATILEDQLAITAAHCINGLHKDDFTLYYGRTFQPDSGIEDQGHRRFGGQTGILAWRIHPSYNVFDKFEGNDIALLKLKRRIQFNDFVRPIKVVPTHHKYDIMYDRARKVKLAGFGQTKGPLDSTNPDDWPDQMQLVEQKIVPEQRCNRGNDTFHFGPPQDGLCTRLKCGPNERQGIQAKFKQICPGDSGSGIVQHFVEDNTFYLLAVVSYTVAHDKRECGLSKKPALSIKTRDHRDFIYEDFFPYKRSKQATETVPPLVGDEVIFITGDYNDASTEVLDLEDGSNCSRLTAELPQRLWDHTMDNLEGNIIICGGLYLHGRSCISTVSPDGPWTNHSTTLTSRASHSSVVLGGKLYLLGGGCCGDPIVESLEGGRWRAEPSPPFDHENEHEILENSCAVTVQNKIIIMGGRAKEDGRRVTQWDLTTNEWTELPSLNTRRWQFGCAVIDQQKIIVGGGNVKGEKLKSCEMYDIDQRRWETIGDFNVARVELQMVTVNTKRGQKVVAMGNWFDTDTGDTVEKLVKGEGGEYTWKLINIKMKKSRHRFAATAVDRSTFCQ